MKLILTQDVNGLGAPGDVVEVKDGYGRNYLLPRGLATAWTKGGEKQVAQIKRAREVREVRDLDDAAAIKSKLEGLKVTLSARTGDTGRLFGAITVGDVVSVPPNIVHNASNVGSGDAVLAISFSSPDRQTKGE